MANVLLRLDSTKDKLILEEAYSINPKPDKQARLEIVNRVSLNEKEVQVCHLSAVLFNWVTSTLGCHAGIQSGQRVS